LICLVEALNDSSILDYNESARSRTTSVYLPALEPREQAAISARGFRKLGMIYEDDDLSRIHYHSCGLPRILHLICYHIAVRAETESLTKGFASGKRVFPNIDKALDSAVGEKDSKTMLCRSKALGRIADAGCRSGLPVDQLKVVGAVAAALIKHRFSVSEIVKFVASTEERCADTEKLVSALCDTGLLERTVEPARNAEVCYSFVHLWERLGLRFLTTYNEVKKMKEDKGWNDEYKSLCGR